MYLQELNANAHKLQFTIGALAAVAWLGFAFYLDKKIHPNVTWIIYLRAGLTLIGVTVMIASLIPKIKGKGLGWIYFLGTYIAISTGVITGRLANDATYMSGLFVVLLLPISFPISIRFTLFFYGCTLLTFIICFYIFNIQMDASMQYSLQNLGIMVLAGLTIAFFSHRYRIVGFITRHKLAKANETLAFYNERFNEELQMASDIQLGILPKLPMLWRGYKINAYWKPMQKVSGDFYDIFRLGEDSIGFLLADASGHGVPAALVTTMAKISFLEQARKTHDLVDIFSRANEQLCRAIPGQFYLTAFFVQLFDDGRIKFSNASHPPAILQTSKGEISHLDTDGMFIGAVSDITSYQSKLAKMDFGDRLIIYTDGVSEMRNKSGDDYGVARIQEVLSSQQNETSENLVKILSDSIHSFADTEIMTDDVTFVVIERDQNWQTHQAALKKATQQIKNLNYSAAIEALVTLKESYPDDSTTILLQARAYFLLGDVSKALTQIQTVLKQEPEHSHALMLIAICYFKNKNYHRALKSLLIVLEHLPTAPAYYLAAKCQLRLKDYSAAKTYLRECKHINPNYRKVREYLDKLT